jgi:hypothetical protein
VILPPIVFPAMTLDNDTLILALATLGGATEIVMILITKASKEGDIVSQNCGHF